MEKRTYLVAEGVPFVNGKAVADDRRMLLTDTEAAFDLAHGRIEAEPAPAPSDGDAPNDPPPADPEWGDGEAPAELNASTRRRR